jgi:hypothetical protein
MTFWQKLRVISVLLFMILVAVVCVAAVLAGAETTRVQPASPQTTPPAAVNKRFDF